MWIQRDNKFSIYFKVHSAINEWILGTFFVKIGEVIVGDQADRSVHLKGCLNWWRDFIDHPRNRYEPTLYEASKETVFLLLASTVLEAEAQPNLLLGEYYQDTFSRFHISHLGMSSFDNVTMVFLKSQHGLERLVWRVGDGEIIDACFGEGEVERVFGEAAVSLERVLHAEPSQRFE